MVLFSFCLQSCSIRLQELSRKAWFFNFQEEYRHDKATCIA